MEKRITSKYDKELTIGASMTVVGAVLGTAGMCKINYNNLMTWCPVALVSGVLLEAGIGLFTRGIRHYRNAVALNDAVAKTDN